MYPDDLGADAPLLHVGYHKTATSWLQDCVFPSVANAAQLDRRSIMDALISTHALSFRAETAREELMAKAPANTQLLLSHEGFLGGVHMGGFFGFHTLGMARRLQETFPDSHVLLVIRNQPDLVASTYKQYVRAGGTHGFRRYLYGPRFGRRERLKRPRFAWEHFDFDAVTAVYESLFGADHVHVFLYEDLRDSPRWFMDQLERRLGLELAHQEVPLEAVNVGLKWASLLLARSLNHLTDGSVFDKRCVVRLLPSHRPVKALARWLDATPLGGPTVRTEHLIKPAISRDLANYYADGNHRLAERYGLGLVERGYPLPSHSV